MTITSNATLKVKTALAALILSIAALSALPPPSLAAPADKGNYETIIRDAEELEREGKLDEALEQYKLAMKASPDKAEPLAKASMMYLFLKKPEEAMAAARSAVKTEPGHRGAWLNKSVIELASGLHSEALSTTKEALRRFPDDTDILNNMATAYLGLGKLNDAEDTLLIAIKIKPDDSSLNYNMACAYSLSGIRASALLYLGKAIALDPSLKQRAKTDPDLRQIRDLEPFRKMTSD